MIKEFDDGGSVYVKQMKDLKTRRDSIRSMNETVKDSIKFNQLTAISWANFSQ